MRPMREARLTRRQALGVAGTGALALALPEPIRSAAQSLEGGLQPELVTVTQRGFAAWWCTDAPADTTVRIARAGGRVRELRLERRRMVHAARLGGLRPDTEYSYELRSGGRAMPRSSANPGRFHTLPLLEGKRLATIAVLNDMHVGEQCSGTITTLQGESVPPCFSARDYAHRMSLAAVGLDSCDPESGEGRLDLGGQVAWLDATLGTLRAEGRIPLVCLHHHVA